MLRKLVTCIKCPGRRRAAWLLPLLACGALMLAAACWLGRLAGRALLPPRPPDHNLDHFRRSTSLEHYLDHIEVLIEPSAACAGDMPILALVSSAPSHVEQRQAIRNTWGRHLTTYFVLGLAGQKLDENLADNYVEAKLHSDLIVFDMPDHYQNLTLKSALMLKWTLDRCPNAGRLFKTDDDVLVNPWTLKAVLEDHPDAKLLGYVISGASLHRDPYSKWHVPRWLRAAPAVPRYLSGTGYLLAGEILEELLTAAKKEPLMNLEDVYLTYLVSSARLGLQLEHDRRLSPYRPWLPVDCAFWSLASTHSLDPTDIAHGWAAILRIEKEYKGDRKVCQFYRSYFDRDLFLY